MIERMQVQGQSATVVWLDDSFNPASKDDATEAKIIFDGGKVIFVEVDEEGEVEEGEKRQGTLRNLQENLSRAICILGVNPLIEGDYEGHPFRGNQWTGGGGGGETFGRSTGRGVTREKGYVTETVVVDKASGKTRSFNWKEPGKYPISGEKSWRKPGPKTKYNRSHFDENGVLLMPGGKTSLTGVSLTALGKACEQAAIDHFGLVNLHPEKNQGTFDLGLKGTKIRIEVKGNMSTNKDLKTKMRGQDRLDKLIEAEANGETPYVMIPVGVVEPNGKEMRVHFYTNGPGLTQGGLPREGDQEDWHYHGSKVIKIPRKES